MLKRVFILLLLSLVPGPRLALEHSIWGRLPLGPSAAEAAEMGFETKAESSECDAQELDAKSDLLIATPPRGCILLDPAVVEHHAYTHPDEILRPPRPFAATSII